jgi:hypothetical protein
MDACGEAADSCRELWRARGGFGDCAALRAVWRGWARNKRRKSVDYEAKAVTLAGRRYIVCRNHDEAKKDATDRAAILAALERQLKTIPVIAASSHRPVRIASPSIMPKPPSPDKGDAGRALDAVDPVVLPPTVRRPIGPTREQADR